MMRIRVDNKKFFKMKMKENKNIKYKETKTLWSIYKAKIVNRTTNKSSKYWTSMNRNLKIIQIKYRNPKTNLKMNNFRIIIHLIKTSNKFKTNILPFPYKVRKNKSPNLNKTNPSYNHPPPLNTSVSYPTPQTNTNAMLKKWSSIMCSNIKNTRSNRKSKQNCWEIFSSNGEDSLNRRIT